MARSPDNVDGSAHKEVVDDVFDADLGDATSNMIAEGQKEVQLVGVEKGVSKTSNNPMWTFTFAVFGAKDDDSGKETKVFCAMSPAALWKLEETVVALGLGKAGEKVSFKKQDAIGRAAMATVVHGDYNGRPQARIERLTPHPKGPDAARKAGAPKF